MKYVKTAMKSSLEAAHNMWSGKNKNNKLEDRHHDMLCYRKSRENKK